ncbi:MFS transporter [Latilactobacillus fuchuensis]|uniref:Transporter n=1 Tax=Latilactobacillus fuchuensis TaxID=164393 RepID=A0A2N9DWV9_9LACO|nr:MFS transporter [Latilactobacillus fuchuensis]SPC39166.1 putative transporter [Latilactobacillus fuchuensis]
MNQKQRANLTLLALAISAFAIGSTEFISVGLMPLMIKDFGITMSQAGLTVSMYALGITIGAPILVILTSRWPRKNLLLGIMLVFIVGNLTVAFAPIFPIVLLGRIISALAHGIFMSIASVIAADVVEPERRASAIAVMFTGLTVATVTGVPLGTFIGQVSTWHMSFIFIAGIGVLGLIANWFLVPNDLPLGQPSHFSGIKRVFMNRQIVLALLITALGYGGTFTVYTFVTPILETKMGWSPSAVVIILVIYGLMVAIGNTLGGKWSNHQPLLALLKMFIGLLVTLIFFLVTLNGHWFGLINVLVMGFFAFMNVPGLQLYIVQLAEKYAPNDIPLASALNISAFNVGITIGSLVGGQASAAWGLGSTPIFGAAMVFISILLTWWLIRMTKKAA